MDGITIDIPGREPLVIKRLCLDYNGTIALDGSLLPGVIFRLEHLLEKIKVDVITADTNHSAQENLAWTGLLERGVRLITIPQGQESESKLASLHETNPQECYAIGNGVNDEAMLKEAGLSVAVIGNEGCSREAIQASMIVVSDIEDALDLLLFPKRLIATLRH